MSKYSNIKIGVLALQGDFECHLKQLGLIGVRGIEVKLPQQLTGIEGLIIPGGESTTMNILLDRFDMREPLRQFVCSKPVWGTCAGMIMLAKNIDDNQAGVKPLGAIDIDVIRNGYGRQVHSFEALLKMKINDVRKEIMVSYIRAPKITRIGRDVKILAEYENSPVLVCNKNVLASSFHSELEIDSLLLEYFLNHFLLD